MRASLGSFRFKQREKDDVADRFRAGQEHRQAIDAEAESARGGHPMLEGKKEFLIEILRLLSRLFEQATALGHRIVQLRVTGEISWPLMINS